MLLKKNLEWPLNFAYGLAIVLYIPSEFSLSFYYLSMQLIGVFISVSQANTFS